MKTLPTQRGGVEAAPGARRRTGLALGVVMTGVLITAVDTTIVVLAPVLEMDLLDQCPHRPGCHRCRPVLLATQVGHLGDSR